MTSKTTFLTKTIRKKMKKTLLLLLLMFFPITLFGQFFTSEIQGEYNQFKEGKKHGDWYTFTMDRIVSIRIKLLSRIEQTPISTTDSIVAMKTVYNMGDKKSVVIYDINTGRIVETVGYKEGLEDGVSKAYWNNGTLRGEVPYKKGMVDGIVKSYASDGTLLTKLLYVNGVEDLHYAERYISDKIIYDTSYVGFNRPIWKYYAKYDTLITTFLFTDSLILYHKNDSLYKSILYNYRGELENITIFTNGIKDTMYSYYTKKRYKGLQSIIYFKDGKKYKEVYYDTAGNIPKNQKRTKRKALGRISYRALKESGLL